MKTASLQILPLEACFAKCYICLSGVLRLISIDLNCPVALSLRGVNAMPLWDLISQNLQSWSQNLKWLEIKNCFWNVITIYNKSIGNCISNPRKTRQEFIYEMRKKLWNEWCNQNLHVLFRRGQRIWAGSKKQKSWKVRRYAGTQVLNSCKTTWPDFRSIVVLASVAAGQRERFSPKI